jgi:DNA gyrase subunit A
LIELQEIFKTATTITPNYTLISDRGVKILGSAEEIVEIFTGERLKVVKKRYELLSSDCENRLRQNNEIIRFIKDKHYQQAEKKEGRKEFVDYLKENKFTFSDYLADMAIYRMTKEEVRKRQLMIEDDTKKLKDYKSVAASDAKIRDKLLEELADVDQKLTDIMKKKEEDKRKVFAKPTKGARRLLV